MKRFLSKAFIGLLTGVLLVSNTSFAINLDPFGDPAELVAVDVEVEPELIFSGSSFVVRATLEEGHVFDLPDVDIPFDLPWDKPITEWSEDELQAYHQFSALLQTSFINGRDWIEIGIYDHEFSLIYRVPVLLQADVHAVLVDDRTLEVTVPVEEQGIDMPVGMYQATVSWKNVGDGEYGNGIQEFEISAFPSYLFEGFGFLLPVDLVDPATFTVTPGIVNVGRSVSINLIGPEGGLVTLPNNWTLSVVKGLFEVEATTGDGTLVAQGPGVYNFRPDSEGIYNVLMFNGVDEVVYQESFNAVDTEVTVPWAIDPNFAAEDGDVMDPFGLGDILEEELGLEGAMEVRDFSDDEMVVVPGEDTEMVVDENGNEMEVMVLNCGDLEQDYWAYEIINRLIASDRYPVVRDGVGVNCRPLTEVKRKEFTAWILNVYHPEVVEAINEVNLSNIPFSDVAADDPYAPYIVKAEELGIIDGHPDGTFKPDATINRAEVLKILLHSSRLFDNDPDDVSDLNDHYPERAPLAEFSDVQESAWYYNYLHFSSVNDIIVGYADGTARLDNPVIYGEAAKILDLAVTIEEVRL